MAKVGIIGGSGLYEIPGLRLTGERDVETPFGLPSSPYMSGELEGSELVFLPRHGIHHNLAPHKINYRANIRGFSNLGVERIISVCASGGINPSLEPGSIVVLDQVLDLTQGARASSFYDEHEVVHIDFTEPFCPELRAALTGAAGEAGIDVFDSGTYICVNGPRLESRAEINHFSSIGADVVGMTAMPEAALAREDQVCLANITVVTNRAAGISGQKLTTREVVENMRRSTERVKGLIKAMLPLIPAERSCSCKDALKDARM
jgi:5'-methylthioadenosine phosphorylase